MPGDGLCQARVNDVMVCTLRAAIQEANAHPGLDTVNLPAGVYELEIPVVNDDLPETGDWDILSPITFVGVGAGNDGSIHTIIDGGFPLEGMDPLAKGMDRLFEIHPSAGNVTFRNLTLREAASPADGGAIQNWSPGLLKLENVHVKDNLAQGVGGGINNAEPEAYDWVVEPVAMPKGGRVEIYNSVFSGNGAGGGGAAINNTGSGSISILAGSRIVDNPGLMIPDPTQVIDPLEPEEPELIPAPGVYSPDASAIVNEGAHDTVGSIRIADSTISGNFSNHDGAGVANLGSGIAHHRTHDDQEQHERRGGRRRLRRRWPRHDDRGHGLRQQGPRRRRHLQRGRHRQDRPAAPLHAHQLDHRQQRRRQLARQHGRRLGRRPRQRRRRHRHDQRRPLQGQLRRGRRRRSRQRRAGQPGHDPGAASRTTRRTARAAAPGSAASGSTTIRDSVFTGNDAGTPEPLKPGDLAPIGKPGDNGFIANANTAGGGGLYTEGGPVTVTGSTFANNTATEEGGGISIDNFGDFYFADSVIRDNRAGADGGGIENSGMRVTFERLHVIGNRASLDGGGIYNSSSGEFFVLDSTLELNNAQDGGGIANLPDADLVVRRTTILRNTARFPGFEEGVPVDGGHGGGFFSMADGDALIENSTISGNFAATAGGGLFHDADGARAGQQRHDLAQLRPPGRRHRRRRVGLRAAPAADVQHRGRPAQHDRRRQPQGRQLRLVRHLRGRQPRRRRHAVDHLERRHDAARQDPLLPGLHDQQRFDRAHRPRPAGADVHRGRDRRQRRAHPHPRPHVREPGHRRRA